MVDRDLVLAKVETLERSLARIEAARERAGLDALDRQDILVLNLQRAILDDDLADRMRRMTGFRNVAVHEYRKLDPSIVDSILRNRLGDLRAFAKVVLVRFRMTAAPFGWPRGRPPGSRAEHPETTVNLAGRRWLTAPEASS